MFKRICKIGLCNLRLTQRFSSIIQIENSIPFEFHKMSKETSQTINPFSKFTTVLAFT